MERKEFYSRNVSRLTIEVRRLRKRNKMFVVSELTTFGLMIAALVGLASTYTGYTYFYLAALMLAAYVIIRYSDVRNSNKIETLENTRSVYQKELAYLDGDFSSFGDGAQYIDPSHPFTFDMDIFGRDSLFNRINRTITTGGSDVLAAMLSGEGEHTLSPTLKELAEAEPLRTQFLSYGQQGIINTTEVLAALQSMKEVALPKWPKSLLSLILACTAIIGLLAAIVLAAMGVIAADLPIIWGLAQFCIVYGLHMRTLRESHKAVNKMHKQLSTYIRLIVLMVESDLKDEHTQALIGRLSTGDTNALASFRGLQRILDGLDRRGNQLGLFLSDAFACSDYFLVRRFIKWQERYLLQVEDWISSVSRFDALVSMATFRYNEPTAIEAEIIDAEEVVYEAEGLRHPFLGEKAISNGFTIRDNHYYIITGANMAGKSTFLRTIGVNYILARCGMPVFADRMKVSVFSLFSSMRTTDDLTQGISYFNAELLRLQQLLEHCRQQKRTLIILDEILKGTNSLDKLNGSRLFIEFIQQLPVTGIIATHDLELSKMADAYPDRFHNYCFEIALSDHVTYTYKITPGVARNQNATFLLKNIVLRKAIGQQNRL